MQFQNDLLKVIISAELQHSAEIELCRIPGAYKVEIAEEKCIVRIKKEGATQTQLSSSSSLFFCHLTLKKKQHTTYLSK